MCCKKAEHTSTKRTYGTKDVEEIHLNRDISSPLDPTRPIGREWKTGPKRGGWAHQPAVTTQSGSSFSWESAHKTHLLAWEKMCMSWKREPAAAFLLTCPPSPQRHDAKHFVPAVHQSLLGPVSTLLQKITWAGWPFALWPKCRTSEQLREKQRMPSPLPAVTNEQHRQHLSYKILSLSLHLEISPPASDRAFLYSYPSIRAADNSSSLLSCLVLWNMEMQHLWNSFICERFDWNRSLG